MIPLNPMSAGVAITAGLGGITMLWGNIKGMFVRLESLIVVKAELDNDIGKDFMDYCWVHFKTSPLGVRKFSADNLFIRSKNRLGRVASEETGKYITFWDGWKPIFLSVNDNNNSNSSGNRSISFIRGSFDLEKLMIDSVNFHDLHKHEKTDKTSRYYVRKIFGKKKSKSNGNMQPGAAIRQDDDEMDHLRSGFKPLFYSKEDLGVPTSKSPMDNLSYEDSVQEFYDEVVRWKNSKEWFHEKKLPWRFGAVVYGVPGSGKTSLTKAIGQSLDMPIHSYDLTTMDNEELVESWQSSLSESPCIVLLEDIDRIFDQNKQIKTSKDKSPLTLDCLLNCISGVQPSDGILVLVTANDVTKLDPALGVPDPTGRSTRPGRLDRAVHVGILNKMGREKIAKRILSDLPELIETVVNEGDGETGAQFESRCSKLALEKYWGRFSVQVN